MKTGKDADQCQAGPSDDTPIAITHALVLEPNLAPSGTPQGILDCEAKLLTDHIEYFSYCCNPPSKYEQNRAVDPEKLWAHPYYENVEWQYADNVGNKKVSTADGQDAFGGDPYGFVMVDSLDHAKYQPWFRRGFHRSPTG